MDGLIVEGFYGFIKVYVNQMNIFIGKVWMYLMIIQVCSFEEGGDKVDLDYKFFVINFDSVRNSSFYVLLFDVFKVSIG